MSYRKTTCILAAATVLGIAGCAAPYDPHHTQYPSGPAYPGGQAYPNYPSQEMVRYGYVESVETVVPERREGPGVGAIGGAIAGGAIGSQIGSGSGRTAAVIGGAVLGGIAGHQVEQQIRNNQASAAEYVFRVRMDDGSYQSFRRETHENIRVGDRVRVQGGNLYVY